MVLGTTIWIFMGSNSTGAGATGALEDCERKMRNFPHSCENGVRVHFPQPAG
jgi:hypothetical protein